MHRLYSFLFSILIPSFVFALSFEETALSILRGGYIQKADSLQLKSLEESLKTSYNLPDFQLDGEFLAAPEGETDRWGAELSWELEWPGVYAARKKEADKRLELAAENIRIARTEKLNEIKYRLIDYIFLTKKIEVLSKLKDSTDSISEFADKAVKGGEITILDLNKVKLEKANVKAAFDACFNDRLEALSDLIEIAGYDCSSFVEKVTPDFPSIVLPDESTLEILKKNAPEVRAAFLEKELAKTSKKVALMEALPSISVGYKHAYEDGVHFNGATLGLSIPVFSSRNKQKSAKASIDEADIKIEAAEVSSQAYVDMMVKRLAIMKNQIDEVRPLIMDSDHSAILLKAYENGLISMIDYLTERNYFTNASLEFLSLQHSAAKTLILLYATLP